MLEFLKKEWFKIGILLLVACAVLIWYNNTSKNVGETVNESEEITHDEQSTNIPDKTIPEDDVEIKVEQKPTYKASQPVKVSEPDPITSKPSTTPVSTMVASESIPDIVVTYRTSATAYDDQGAYGLYLSISAGEHDIYIPKGTSASQGEVVGFYYTVNGSEFSGTQDSLVTCDISTGDNCRIKAGTTRPVKVAVWLFPYSSGNYGVTFTKMRYSINGITNNYAIGEEAGPLFVQ